jgi:hypothetical protein
VDAERPPALGDVDDAVDELGHLLGERGELVDDEHERGRGIRVGGLLELEQVFRLLAVEQVLAVVQLGAQARERAAHEMRAEVGDEAHAVRQADAVGEGRSALVVDEEERHALGAVLGGHAEHPRLQELALARAGRAADEGVRALLAQVEVQGALRALTDEGAQLGLVAGARARRADRRVLRPPVDDGVGAVAISVPSSCSRGWCGARRRRLRRRRRCR